MATAVNVQGPFAEMGSAMQRAFGDSFPRARFVDWNEELRGGVVVRGARIPLDVYESTDTLTVEAPLPGFRRDDIDVMLERGKLTIRPQSAEEAAESDGRNYFMRERHHGALSRSILIGESYDPDSLAAVLSDGLLTITMKKSLAAQPRHIQVSAG